MNIAASIIHILLALILSPLLIGIINRTKAKFAGRKGQPLLQPYYDLIKLIKKGSVYSTTTTWVFRLGPVAGLGAIIISIMIIPSGGIGGMLSFTGDFILMAYILGMARFVTVIAAMDTGSAFEGMGASREVQFAIIAEVVLLLGLAVLAIGTREISLSGIYAGLWNESVSPLGPVAFLVAFAFLIVLDHGGVDLAFIQYGASLKLWLFSALLVGIAMPLRTGAVFTDMTINVIGIFIAAVLVGIIESCMARLRLLHVPQMLIVALSVTVAALLWILR
jgi:formate hydrogenlyase subunit 4